MLEKVDFKTVLLCIPSTMFKIFICQLQKITIVIFGLLLLFIEIANATPPVITSYNGTMEGGNIIAINGSNFGTENTTSYLVYDNYDDNAYWPAGGYDGNPVAFQAWLNDGKTWARSPDITDLIYDGTIDLIGPNNLFQVHKSASFFSTGWGFRKNVEKRSSSTGVEGDGLVFNTPTHPTEVWIRWYERWSPGWVSGNWNPLESKQAYIKIGDWAADHDYIMPHIVGSGGTSQAWWRVYNNSGNQGICLDPSGNDCGYKQVSVIWSGVNRWNEIKIHVKLGEGATDQFEWWLNGNQVMSLSNIDLDSDGVHKYITGVIFGANFSGPIGTSFLTTDEEPEDRANMVISSSDPKSVAAVFLSNSSTWGNLTVGSLNWNNGTSTYVKQKVGGTGLTERGYQAYSDRSLKFEVNTIGLNIGQPIYLYVTNWYGETNGEGFLLIKRPESPAKLQ